MNKKMTKLYELLEKYNYHYHTLNESLIDDLSYDKMMLELIELEKKNPKLKKENSVTEQVGNEVIENFEKYEHKTPMLSLSNAFSYEDLYEFDQKISNKIQKYKYVVELKIDGVAISIHYDNKMNLAVTRGNGLTGENVTHNIKTIKSLPENIKDLIEVRGEVYISKSNFEKINEKENATYANPRNLASGTIRQLNNKIARQRNLDVFVYGLVNYENFGHKSYYESMIYLQEKGFKINEQIKEVSSMKEVIKIIETITQNRDKYDYEIDGVVVKISEYENQKILGYTSKFPKWAIAYKFTSQVAITKLKNITYTVGRTGKITPNAILESVNLMGSNISKATLHNKKYIEEHDFRIGDFVKIIKAGDIIPRVAEVVIDMRSNEYERVKFIKICPECNSHLELIENDYFCNNKECRGRNVEKLIHFASINNMNIVGLGEKIIEKLYNNDIISDYIDIYTLNYEKLEQIEGFKEKSILKILESIEESKKCELANFIAGLGIKNLGLQSAKELSIHIKTIDEFIKLDETKLIDINGFGSVVIENTINFLKEENNIKKIFFLKNNGMNFKNTYYQNTNETKMTFVITGTFEKLSRIDIKNKVESLGHKISSSVSTKTDYLIAGKKAGSKMEKAINLNIKIIDEKNLEDFWKVL